MLVLGLHGGAKTPGERGSITGRILAHDSGAVLLDDGRVVAAVEEERISRVKHTDTAPLAAARRCLELGGVGIDDVDLFSFCQTESFLDQMMLAIYARNRDNGHVTGRHMIQDLLKKAFAVDIPVDRFRFADHHLCHAASAFYPSAFDRALVVTIDGVGISPFGGGRSVAAYEGNGAELTELFAHDETRSLGFFYHRVTRHLGWKLHDEYKVMGLAPHGDASLHRDVFEQMYELLPDGEYRFLDGQPELLASICETRTRDAEIAPIHCDIAASLQESLERITFHMLGHLREKTGHDRLCLAGGVALNCSMNGKLLTSGMFDEIFVQPAASDSGLPLGSALYTYMNEGPDSVRREQAHMYLGASFGTDQETLETLQAWSDFVDFERVEDSCKSAAELIAAGAVIGWVQGRAEYGPRALGNRSILADPCPPEHKDIINAKVKKREAFRPFGPSVMEEYADECFEMANGDTPLAYMVFVVQVKEAMRKVLGAVTHVDGTARIQTVSKEHNPRYWRLIDEFRKISGVPVMLNTSFNNNAEPIVDSAEDAVICFLTTGLDYLVVGDFVISKREVEDEHFEKLRPSVPIQIVLHDNVARGEALAAMNGNQEQADWFSLRGAARRVRDALRPVPADPSGPRYEAANDYDERTYDVSERAFWLLSQADGFRTLGSLMTKIGLTEAEERSELLTEIRDLWSRRVVRMSADAGAAVTSVDA